MCFDGAQEGAHRLGRACSARRPRRHRTGPSDTDLAHLSYTSGTSGPPKGACLAHEPTMRATRCIAERLRLRAHDVSLGPTALSSSYQLVANLLPVLHVGGTACVMSRWDARDGLGRGRSARAPRCWRAIRPCFATCSTRALAAARPPSRLRLGLSGGGPSRRAQARWRDRLGLPLCESYGQSELGGFVGLGRRTTR